MFAIAILTVCFLFLSRTDSSAFQLSQSAELSLITCSPGNGAATVYGHSAIRVFDPARNYDLVFNYGIYDFEAPNFLYRFASGETDYLLAAYNFDAFVKSYKRDKRSVYEQVLNLTADEKQRIFDFLVWNAKKENRIYRYNFFFDNCATRVRDVIANNVDGGIAFREENQSHLTLRQLIDAYHGKLLWLTFGIDMVVSSGSDREASFWEEMFLPDYLMEHFADAKRNNDNTDLIKDTIVVYEAPENVFRSHKLLSPLVVVGIITLLVFWASWKQFRRGHMKHRWDYWVYGFNGFMGIVIAWFTLYSEHPAMSPNYNLLWAVPVNFLFMLVMLRKKWRPRVEKYHLLIAVWLLVFILVSPFVPQHFHPVFYLLLIMVLVRSLFHSLLMLQKGKRAS